MRSPKESYVIQKRKIWSLESMHSEIMAKIWTKAKLKNTCTFTKTSKFNYAFNDAASDSSQPVSGLSLDPPGDVVFYTRTVKSRNITKLYSIVTVTE